MTPQDQVERSDAASDPPTIRRVVSNGANVNADGDQGASVLFSACLAGDAPVVRLLLDLGADPNLCAEDPAAIIYADTVLDLVLQAQVVSNREKYTPVYDLLVAGGARDSEGSVPDAATNEQGRARALDWQTSRDASAQGGS